VQKKWGGEDGDVVTVIAYARLPEVVKAGVGKEGISI